MNELYVKFPKPCDERWEDMAPSGCNRHCAACDKVIHDLEQMTGAEAQALLDSGEEACVRAKVGPSGDIRLKGSSHRSMPRFRTLAAGAVASLSAAACTGTNSGGETGFTLSGSVTPNVNYGVLELQRVGEKIDRKPGPRPKGIKRQEYLSQYARTDANGEYSFEGVARGRYTLSWSSCHGEVQLAELEIDQGSVELPDFTAPSELDDQYCEIIIGAMIRADTRSRRP